MNKVFVVLLICLGLAYYLGDRQVKEKGYIGLGEFLSLSVENYSKSFGSEAQTQTLSITIAEKPYAKLEALVEKARREGVIPRKGNKFRKATLVVGGQKHNVELRIKGKLTDHVEGDKWSLRVKVKDGSNVFGMSRFSLQHPGTRNYANEWVFHELARKEGLIALRYDFVKVEINENALGVYALEEHFGQELLAHNGRDPGPILRFDPGLYWQHRLNLMNEVHVLEEYAEFSNANIDAYTEGTIFGDSSLSASFYKAQAKLEAFRSGNVPVDSVFKIVPLARYHALIDLVGGHHSLDWSDVKYYYDPSTDLLEPVAYESFSVFPTRSLAGSYRYKGPGTNVNDLHDALFNNELFFRAYIKELRRISDTLYVEEFFQEIDEDLNAKLAILYGEFPYKEFSNVQYHKNAMAIQSMLDTPQAFHAYFQKMDPVEGSIRVRIRTGMIESLPVEIIGFRTNKKDTLKVEELGLTGNCVLPAKTRRAPIKIRDFEFVLPTHIDVDTNKRSGWRVYYKILGDDRERKVTVLPYAYLPGYPTNDRASFSTGGQSNDPLVQALKQDKEWVLEPGTWTINKKVIVPSGVKLIAGPGVEIDLNLGGELEILGKLECIGDPRSPVCIRAVDGGGSLVLKGKGRSIFKNVLFEHNGSKELVQVVDGVAEIARCRAISPGSVIFRVYNSRITSLNNVFVLEDSATAYELNTAKFISRNDRRVGPGVYISGTGSYIENTSFQSAHIGTFMDLAGCNALTFRPIVEQHERCRAVDKSVLEFRDLQGELNSFNVEVADDVRITVNGKVAALQNLVAK